MAPMSTGRRSGRNHLLVRARHIFATLQEASAPWGALLADNPIAPPIGNNTIVVTSCTRLLTVMLSMVKIQDPPSAGSN